MTRARSTRRAVVHAGRLQDNWPLCGARKPPALPGMRVASSAVTCWRCLDVMEANARRRGSEATKKLNDLYVKSDDVQRRRRPLERKIDGLIARSSLGTPEALAVRAGADPRAVDRVLKRADELARKAK